MKFESIDIWIWCMTLVLFIHKLSLTACSPLKHTEVLLMFGLSATLSVKEVCNQTHGITACLLTACFRVMPLSTWAVHQLIRFRPARLLWRGEIPVPRSVLVGQTSLATGRTKCAIEYWVSHLMSSSELKVRLSRVFVLLCGTLLRHTCQIEYHLESISFNLSIGLLTKYAGSDTGGAFWLFQLLI